MTICVSVKVAEGLVFAADSTISLEGKKVDADGNTVQAGIIQTFEYASKVTQVKDYPIGVMSWGAASIGSRTIQSLIMEFEYDYKNIKENSGYTVKTIAKDLIKFIKDRYDLEISKSKGPGPTLGLLIGGYSYKKFFPDLHTTSFPSAGKFKIEAVRQSGAGDPPNFGCDWFGQIGALQRLIKGYDDAALQELVNRGVDKDIIQKWVDDSVSELPIVFDGMPLQDAVDFANYVVNVVIGRFRFGIGPPTCGGEVDIAVIRPNNFDWAQRKRWSIK